MSQPTYLYHKEELIITVMAVFHLACEFLGPHFGTNRPILGPWLIHFISVPFAPLICFFIDVFTFYIQLHMFSNRISKSTNILAC